MYPETDGLRLLAGFCEFLRLLGNPCNGTVPLHRQLMRRNGASKGNTKSPTDKGQYIMSLNVKMVKYQNQLINEEIVVPRLVNQQTLDFYALCDYLADGSTVTPGDVAAVMKLIEVRMPLILGLNTKVVCSPEGLTFRPVVSGSITQSQLKRKLEARLEEDPDADIDVNRTLKTSDLTVNDLTASIAIDLPRIWNERFRNKATFKRTGNIDETMTEPDSSEDTDNTGGSSTGNTGGDSNPGGGLNE